MEPIEILEKVLPSAFDDFDIPLAERDDFKYNVAEMFEDLSLHAPVDTSERFMQILAAYSDASRRALCCRNVPIVDAACYTTELCLAVHYAEQVPVLKDAVNVVFTKMGC